MREAGLSTGSPAKFMMSVEEAGTLLNRGKNTAGDDFITVCIDQSNHWEAWLICICLAMV